MFCDKCATLFLQNIVFCVPELFLYPIYERHFLKYINEIWYKSVYRCIRKLSWFNRLYLTNLLNSSSYVNILLIPNMLKFMEYL